MRVLQSEGVFGKKIAVDSVHNILVNNKGNRITNICKKKMLTKTQPH